MLDVVLCYTKNYVYYLFYVSCFIQYLTQIQLKCLNGKTWKTNTNQRTNFCVGKKRKAVQTISFFVFSRVFCLFWWNKLFQKKILLLLSYFHKFSADDIYREKNLWKYTRYKKIKFSLLLFFPWLCWFLCYLCVSSFCLRYERKTEYQFRGRW